MGSETIKVMEPVTSVIEDIDLDISDDGNLDNDLIRKRIEQGIVAFDIFLLLQMLNFVIDMIMNRNQKFLY